MLRLEAVLVHSCLLLLYGGRHRLFATFLINFRLLDLDLAGLLDLLCLGRRPLVGARGGLTGTIVVVIVC
jgi:hypothetical protein